MRAARERILSGADPTPRAASIRAAGRIATWAYGPAVVARNAAYDAGILPVQRVDAHVISIGNITAGGTGKTPMAAACAQSRIESGDRVAILLRGYRAAEPDSREVVVVSDGEGMRYARTQAGDEAWLLSERVPAAVVAVCPDRVRAARFVIESFGTTCIVLDDGFQHRRLARDEDWVLIDASDPWGYGGPRGALLPRGLLREPLRGLRRATTVVISRVDDQTQVDAIVEEVRRHNASAPIRFAVHQPARLTPLGEEGALAPNRLASARVLALSGIGNPAAFEHTVRALGAHVVLVQRFADHHAYTRRDLVEASQFVRSEGLDAIVTTEKDAVRLHEAGAPPCPVWVLGIDAVLFDSLDDARQASLAGTVA